MSVVKLGDSSGPAAGELPRVLVVILNYNNWSDTLQCLMSLSRLDYPNFSIVVCDNQSTDDSLQNIDGWAKGTLAVAALHPAMQGSSTPRFSRPLRYAGPMPTPTGTPSSVPSDADIYLLPTGKNGGFAFGNNVGISFGMRDTKVRYFWLLNNDTVVHANALRELVARAEVDRRRGIVGSTLLNYDPPHAVQAVGGAVYKSWSGRARPIRSGAFDLPHLERMAPGIEAKMGFVIGASMLVSRAFIEQVGLLSEEYFLYSEELDWARRASGRFRLGYAPRSIVYHRLGGSTGERRGSMLSTFHLYRSRIKFVVQHDLWALATVYAVCLYEVLKMLARGRFSCARAATSGTMSVGIGEILRLARVRRH